MLVVLLNYHSVSRPRTALKDLTMKHRQKHYYWNKEWDSDGGDGGQAYEEIGICTIMHSCKCDDTQFN